MKRHKGLIVAALVFLLFSQVLLAVFAHRPAAEEPAQMPGNDIRKAEGPQEETDRPAEKDTDELQADQTQPPAFRLLLPGRTWEQLAREYPPFGMAGIVPGTGDGLLFAQMSGEQAEQIMERVLQPPEPENEPEPETQPVSSYENRVVITAAAYLNIREENDPESRVIGKIYHGTSADLLEQGESFSKITSGAITGWVSNNYILTGEAAETYAEEQGSVTIATVTAAWLNVREQPDTQAGVVATVEAGQWFIVKEQAAGWVKIDYTSGMEGYLNGQYVTVSQNYGQAISVSEEQELIRLAEEKEAQQESQSREEQELLAARSQAVKTETTRAAETTQASISASTQTSAGTAAVATPAETAKGTNSATAQSTVPQTVPAATPAAEQTPEPTQAPETTKAPEITQVPETTQTPEPARPPETQAPPAADPSGYDDLYLLAALAQMEAGYNYDGCLAVASVVMNRVKSGSYPNSIEGVIYQSGQFPGTGTGGALEKILLAGPGSTPKQAAADAMAGANNIGDFTQFCPDSYAASVEYPFAAYKVVGGNCFYQN